MSNYTYHTYTIISYLLFGWFSESRIPVDVDGWSIEAELSGLIGRIMCFIISTSESL